jgi:TPP-dependent trihydroxycyclohexane-1,2-dione (THcHDO) dehydratase
MSSLRLTVGQAIVPFSLPSTPSVTASSTGLIEGLFGILGHGNVAGLGAAVCSCLGHGLTNTLVPRTRTIDRQYSHRLCFCDDQA